MGTVHELTSREKAIGRAYAGGQDVATIAAARGEDSQQVGETLIRLFGLNRGTAREAVRRGQVCLGEDQAPAMPDRKGGRPRKTVPPSVAKWPEQAIDAGAEWIAEHVPPVPPVVVAPAPAPTVPPPVDRPLAEYNARHCLACRWTGVDGHPHPTVEAVVRVVAAAGVS